MFKYTLLLDCDMPFTYAAIFDYVLRVVPCWLRVDLRRNCSVNTVTLQLKIVLFLKFRNLTHYFTGTRTFIHYKDNASLSEQSR
jgi:hypothetical protein